MSSTILISSRITFFSRSISSGRKCRTKHDVREQVDREREVLVEHLDVVAGVFLRGERVELPADGIDCLRDVLSRAGRGALEEHVLDEVGNPLRASTSWREPRVSHTPIVTDRTWGIVSVISRNPLSSTLADDHTLWSGVRHLTVPPRRNGTAPQVPENERNEFFNRWPDRLRPAACSSSRSTGCLSSATRDS